jgi:hypothetical protein
MADSSVEQRGAARSNDKNFLDFEIISADGAVVGRGLARTLNVSATGLLLETSQPFTLGQTLRITLGLRDDLVQITGKVAHAEATAAALYSAGVCFLAFPEEDRATYQKHLAALQRLLGG